MDYTPTPGIGGAVRVIRKHRQMTQAQLAAAVGVAPATISGVETNRTNLSARLINDIAAALGYEVHVRLILKGPR